MRRTMHWRWLILNSLICLSVSLIGVASGEVLAEEVCRICDGCIYGSISCQEAGRLHMLPNDLPNGTQKVIIVSQRFDSQFLSQQNISSYTLPGVQIQELTIMDCGLRAIEARTFHGLNSLTKLDLSKNFLSRIQGHTFSGLRLHLLRLDDNQGLTLDAEAFLNLTVSSISIQNCGLRSLSYEVFQPLLQSGTLTTLRLTSNSLTTLDARFEPFFRTLSFLSLARNPFICDCKLMWLSRILQRKRRTDNDDEFPLISDDRLLIVSDDDHPVCESSNRLRGRQIVSLTSSDFLCEPPQMLAMEVDFSDFQINHSDNRKGVVFLKCAAQGSPEIRMAWFRQDRCENKLIQLPSLKQVVPGVVEVPISYHFLANNSKCKADDASQLFTCAAVDSYGNASANLFLRWPAPLASASLPPLKSLSNYSSIVPSPIDARLIDEKQGLLQSNHFDEFFFMKKFTILELIGAVVGTFTATIFLFLVGYILLYMRHRHQFSKGPTKIVYPFTANTRLPKFADYQVLEYSPQHPIQDSLKATGNKSCDLTTDKRLLMSKTEWPVFKRSSNLRANSSVYSECSNYDLPSNQFTSASLPPVPPDPPPFSPPPLTINQLGTIGGASIAYPQPHFHDPAISAATTTTVVMATGNGSYGQSNSVLAQGLTTNAILVDAITNQKRKCPLQLSPPSQEFRFYV